MMKAKKFMMTVILAGAVMGLVACNNSGKEEQATKPIGDPITTQTVPNSNENNVTDKDGFFFDANGVTITTDQDLDAILSGIGESKSKFSAPSCAGEGTDYIYDYGSFQIETYPSEDGKNLIGLIELKDDMVSTKEGIDLSMTKEDVIKAYGNDYEETPNGITYSKGGTKLSFLFEDDKMISIQYVSAVIG